MQHGDDEVRALHVPFYLARHAIQPVQVFCCGLALDTGVQVILSFHTLSCVFYMATTVMNIVFEIPTFGNDVTLATQFFNCAFALATVPFIISGISGVKYGVEVHLRVYLYWLTVTFLLDLIFMTLMGIKSSCTRLPGFLQLHGGAFACGAFRMAGIVTYVLSGIIAGYSVFVVWSRCEELQLGGSEPSFDKLAEDTMIVEEKTLMSHKSGLFGTGRTSENPQPLVYGSLASPVVAGSVPIFGGRHHETSYPPGRARFNH